jgi:PAS domain S-box-containing protein
MRTDESVAGGAKDRPWTLRYGAALIAAAAALVIRIALDPLIGPTELAYTIFLPAVLFAAWFGGFGPGIVCAIASGFAADYFFAEPLRSFLVRKERDEISLVIFVVVALAMAWLVRSLTAALDRTRQAENAERVERRRFETTLASIGDAVIATDRTGAITYMNAVAEELTGWQNLTAAGHPLKHVFRIVNEDSRQPVEDPVAKVFAQGHAVGLANHTVLIMREGSERAIDDSAAPIRDDEGHIVGVVLIFRDISEQRRAEREREALLLAEERLRVSQEARTALEAAEAKFRGLLESAPDPIVVANQEGQILLVNSRVEKAFGYPRGELLGKSIDVLLPERFRAIEAQRRAETIAHAGNSGEHEALELSGLHKEGHEFPTEVNLSPLQTEEGVLVIQAIRDVTLRKRREEKMRLLSMRLLRTQDDERRRIARELHDSAGQYLAAIAMTIDAVKREMRGGPPSLLHKLDEASEVTSACIKEVRTISHLLHPPLLEELGLAAAVRWYVEGFTARSGIHVDLHMPEDLPRLGTDVEMVLFRVLQEAITNVHRHSGSKTAAVSIGADSAQAWVEVQDFGKGNPQFQPGVGMTGMRERVRDLAGSLDISSNQTGTRVKAIVPLRAAVQKSPINGHTKASSASSGHGLD